MTVESLINRFTQYALWLYYQCRQLERWELAAIGVAVVAVLLVVGIRRRAKSKIRYLSQRSPIVGIRLAGHRRH